MKTSKAFEGFAEDLRKRLDEYNEESYKKGYEAGYKDGAAKKEYNDRQAPRSDE